MVRQYNYDYCNEEGNICEYIYETDEYTWDKWTTTKHLNNLLDSPKIVEINNLDSQG